MSTHPPLRSTRASPPRIFGLRGTPQEAPENTLASLLGALELGLEGVAYDVRACASGELVLLADAYLDRTTDLCGLLAHTSLRELASADAGVHLAQRFGGERVPFLGEVLDGAPTALHLIFAPEPQTLEELSAQLGAARAPERAWIASDDVEACRRARELGLATLWVAATLDERVRERVAAERFDALGATASAWRDAASDRWSCQRVCLRCDSPEDLLWAHAADFDALVTSEPRRALAVRTLCEIAPLALERFPLTVERLEVGAATELGSEGEWCGAWRPLASLRSPFDRALRASFELRVRRGAFRCGALPERLELAPRASTEFEFELTGGSWSPGGDPLLLARLELGERDLVLDAPLERVRCARLHPGVMRLPLLREAPRSPPASVTVRRQRGDLLAAIEAPGELEGAQLVVRLGERVHFAAAGLRAPLPAHFERELSGVPFNVGVLGHVRTPRGRRRVLRRWAGGLPDVAPSGAPGRLLPAS